jgi:hypothetical protein
MEVYKGHTGMFGVLPTLGITEGKWSASCSGHCSMSVGVSYTCTYFTESWVDPSHSGPRTEENFPNTSVSHPVL